MTEQENNKAEEKKIIKSVIIESELKDDGLYHKDDHKNNKRR